MRRFVHDFLKWFPAAIAGGAVAIAAVWSEAKDWIAQQVALGCSQMTDPWIAFFVLVSIAAYLAAIIWTGQERKPKGQSGVWLMGEGLDHMNVSVDTATPLQTKFFPLAAPQRQRNSSWLLSLLPEGFKTREQRYEERLENERQSRLTAAELDRENRVALQRSRRDAIADCRKMIAEWDGGISHKEQRAAMERNSSYLALRSHLPQYFLDHLDKNVLVVIDGKRPDKPVSMAALAHHLDRLEKEWGLT